MLCDAGVKMTRCTFPNRITLNGSIQSVCKIAVGISALIIELNDAVPNGLSSQYVFRGQRFALLAPKPAR